MFNGLFEPLLVWHGLILLGVIWLGVFILEKKLNEILDRLDR